MSAAHPYERLTPQRVLDALQGVGLFGDGRLLQLNSYENRVFQAMLEDGSAVVAKFYRPGRWSKQALLGGLYITRSLVLAIYFAQPATPLGTLLFAACMGFLWLGVGPLISGSVVEMFGLRWQAMIQGIAFMSHQAGSFVGALGGGVLFDLMGNYDLAWKIGVGCGLVGGTLQLLFAAPRLPPARLEPAPG